MSPPLLITLESVTKRYGAVTAVDGISLEIPAGEFFALLGPSGCGKTTLMRLIAGFETPDAGRILIDGQDLADVPAYRRPVNMMFQSYALFPHMSVGKNIAFGLVQEGMPRAEIGARVADLLRLVQLEGFADRRPDQLSGGQRQRVALARALARRPRLLLLDEPLAALDRKLREDTQFELMRIQRELGTAFVLVTHDQDEAMAMSQRIAVMRAGRFEQIGTPQTIYDEPHSRFVASFVGDVNLFDGVVETAGGDRCTVLLSDGLGSVAAKGAAVSAGDEVAVALRPENLVLGPEGLPGSVVDCAFRGDTQIIRISLANGQLVKIARFGAAAQTSLQRDMRVHVSFEPGAARVVRS